MFLNRVLWTHNESKEEDCMKEEGKAQRFDPSLKASDLSRTVLIDLWHRTITAYGNLFRTWHKAVSDRFGETIAEELATRAWPQYHKGIPMRELFFDDLKLGVAAVQLMPTLLTVVKLDNKLIPRPLHCSWTWFRIVRALAGLGRRVRPSSGPPVNRKRLAPFGYLRAKFMDSSRGLLLRAWHLSDRREKLGKEESVVDVDDILAVDQLDAAALAQLWNMAAIAYMMVTYGWYSAVKEKYGAETAQQLEKEVWLNRGAAEYDLQIGLDALGVTGKDVESLLRGFQFAPGEVGILNVEFELKSPNHGILHHRTCPAVDRFEDYDDARLKHCCDLCVLAMPLSGEMLDKGIKCRPLKLPPRPRTDIVCEWEYELGSS
jgi:hypothetical protein